MLTINIKTDNEATRDAAELARILRGYADRLANNELDCYGLEAISTTLVDINGNIVGKATITLD